MSAITRRGLQVDDPLAPRPAPGHALTSPDPAGPSNTGEGPLRNLPLDAIRANPDQPRKRFDESALASLADSIRERGVLQPIIVRPIEDGYELVVGERRWRAAQLAGETTIPALVDDALDHAGSLELALIENVVRADLTPIEQARTLATLLDDLRLTATVLARRLGRSRADIAKTVRLLELPDEAIDLIDSGTLSKGHGKALLAEPDHERRGALVRRAAEAGWSVRALEAEIARHDKPSRPKRSAHPDHCAAAAQLEEAITRATGCEARATPHRQGFRIILDQHAAERLARILHRENAQP
jgi:ParB family transcriptional regulator, chromosome partitioning protein